MRYICKCCASSYNILPEGLACSCGASLWMDYPHNIRKNDIKFRDFSMWRYEAALPFQRSDDLITLGEGLTPLLTEEWNRQRILIKNESAEPTGSFKDRGIAMSINAIRQQGLSYIAEDSSGNAGASTAAYAAKAGILCDIYIPDYTSDGKVSQAAAFGANVRKIPGTRHQTAAAARSGPEGAAYIGHNWHPAFVEGIKTIAYEIWEQLDFSLPDAVICPVGNGSLAAGLFLGFSDLIQSGELSEMPRIYGVQSALCNPISRLFRGESADFLQQETVAEGIALYRSSKGSEIAAMIRKSGGSMVDVSEQEILDALYALLRKGLYAEPTSAAAFAGLSALQQKGLITADQSVTVILSGNGLKAKDTITKLLQHRR